MKDLPDLQVKVDCILLKVRALPNASRNGLAGLSAGDALKVSVTAAPEKGKANQAIRKVLSKALGLKSSQVSIHSGETSRDKWFRVEGVQAERLRKVLEEGLKG